MASCPHSMLANDTRAVGCPCALRERLAAINAGGAGTRACRELEPVPEWDLVTWIEGGYGGRPLPQAWHPVTWGA